MSDDLAAHDAKVRGELAAEFRRQADPSTTGIWRDAVDLLDSLADRDQPCP